MGAYELDGVKGHEWIVNSLTLRPVIVLHRTLPYCSVRKSHSGYSGLLQKESPRAMKKAKADSQFDGGSLDRRPLRSHVRLRPQR